MTRRRRKRRVTNRRKKVARRTTKQKKRRKSPRKLQVKSKKAIMLEETRRAYKKFDAARNAIAQRLGVDPNNAYQKLVEQGMSPSRAKAVAARLAVQF